MHPFTKTDLEFLIIVAISILFLWFTFLRVHCITSKISFFSDEVHPAKRASGLMLALLLVAIYLLKKIGAIYIEDFYLETRAFFILAMWESIAAFILSFIKSLPYISLFVGLMTITNWVFAWGTYAEDWSIFDSPGLYKYIPLAIEIFIVIIGPLFRRKQ